MLQAALTAGTATRRSVFELFAGDCRRVGGTASWPGSAGPPALGASASTTRRCGSDRYRVVDARRWTGWPTIASPATSGATPRARSTSRGRRCWSSSHVSPRPCVLETLLLDLNHDSAIAAAASRMTRRRGPAVHRDGFPADPGVAAVAAARAAYIAGFAATSNLEAGRRYGVPTRGTSAHAFTLLHDNERRRSRAQVAALGAGTTLLVDTYDVTAAVRTGVELTAGRARRGPARLRRPGPAGQPGAATAGRARGGRRPGSWSPATWTSTRSRRWRRPGRRLRRGHRPGHRQRPADRGFVYKLVARADDAAGRPAGSRWPRRASARSASAVASGRSGDWTTTASPRPR